MRGPFSFLSGGGGAPVFDPATLALELWVRGSYAGSPWTGVASAGGSGGRNLTEATNAPSVGTAQNGYAPADFDGINDLLNGTTFSTYVNNGSGSLWVLFRADTADADAGAGNRISNPGLVFQDTGATTWGLGYSDAGVTLAHYDGDYEELAVPASTGAYHLAQLKWNGSTAKLRVDSGAWDLVGAGDIDAGGAPLVVGKNYAANCFDGRILEIGISKSVFSDGTFDNIKSYANARYALAL